MLILLALHLASSAIGAEPPAKATDTPSDEEKDRAMKWISFPDDRLTVSGLPWFDENAPRLWRLPARAVDRLPGAVRRLMRYPTGGRIRFASDTSQLKLRVTAPDVQSKSNMSALGCRGFDAYVDGVYWRSACVQQTGAQELTFFQGANRRRKEITIYLPLYQEVEVGALAIDPDAEVEPPGEAFALERPVVYYGSSVAHGGCACRPAMTYEAILARRLNVDFINLAFSGAGKAEPEVVELLAQADASCFVLDVGKSFGRQPSQVYGAMLDTLRAAHPDVPVVCVTPIFSTREFYDAAYAELSEYVRDAVRQAATERIRAGDGKVHVAEGLELLGPADADAFHEGVHPTDLGFSRIADRLEPLMTTVLFPGAK